MAGRRVVGAVVAIVVAASFAAGYLAGGSAQPGQTVTSTSTATARETVTSTVTSTTTIASGPPISIADIATANLSLGRSPGYLAVDSRAGRVYYAVGDSLIVLNTSFSPSFVANISLPSGASGVVVDPSSGAVFVSIQGGVVEVNGSANAIIGQFALDSYSGALAYNLSTDTLYVPAGGLGPVNSIGMNGSLVGFDVRTGSVVMNISLSFQPYNLAVNPETNMVHAEGCHQSFACDSMVSIINGTSRKVVATVSLNSAYFSTMTYDQATNIVYASGGAELVALNGTTGARVFEVNPETCGPFLDIVAIPSLDQVLMVPQNYDYLLVYDGTSGALVNMYSYSSSLQSHPYLQSVAYDPDTHELYLTTSSGQFLAFPDSNILGNVNASMIGAGETCLPV